MRFYKKNRIINVLGMHRSGTSALSRALQVMDVELGDKLMPANDNVNAKGFWEDLEINALNIEMLEVLGSKWDALIPISESDVKFLHYHGYYQRAVELLNVKTCEFEVFGLKDPRIAKLMPFWKTVFSHDLFDVSYLVAIRNPLSVVRSLHKRDGFSSVKSYMLWYEYTILSLVETCGAKRSIVDFDLLMHSPESELRRISEQLDLEINQLSLTTYTTDFLDSSLQHTVFDLTDLSLDDSCPQFVKEVYETLQAVASGQIEDDSALEKKISLWMEELKRISPILGLVDESTDRSDPINKEFGESYKKISELTDRITLSDKTINDLSIQLLETQKKLDDMSNSKSMRITLPLRKMASIKEKTLVQLRRYAAAGFRYAKNCYTRLPLPVQTKAKIKRFLLSNMPWLLSGGTVGANYTSLAPINLVTIPSLPNCKVAAKLIKLKNSTTPLVTIVIPIYGQYEYTIRCLLSIQAHEPNVSYEIIVVDDCSPDDSFQILKEIDCIRLIRNEVNQGFIRSCNTGAKLAKGSYIYFLNNDTQVTPGWLDELVRTFDLLPCTGLVGSKLVYPNGTLQEAGGIIWRNGNAWNFGRHQDPLLPIYNYAREVDYCSGASIMLPKLLFKNLGGFDEHYLPAYCEDADLALKIRDLGYRVIYQPLSVVVHFEGITSGTDTSKGVKSHQIENTRKMFERWELHLQTHQSDGENIDLAKDRCATRRVLVIDHCTPTPDQDAGSVTVFNLMVLLREMKFQVTFIPEHNFLYMSKYTPALQQLGVEMLYSPYVTSVKQHLKDHGHRYELVLMFRPNVVENNLSIVRKYAPHAKVLFHTVDLHYLRMVREADLSLEVAKRKEAIDMKNRELRAIRSVDATIVHSTAELELLRPELPNEKIFVFPLVLDVAGSTKSFEDRCNIAFVGGYQHAPNIDAVKYFTTNIMPILRENLPGVKFYVVGSNAPAEVLALAADDVVIVGFVEDLNLFLNNIRVSVAPLRYGAGIKGKVGTAMAIGLPIVATSIAAEGMKLSDGENILVADGQDDFAQAVINLYQNKALWSAISASSVEFANSTWGAEAAWRVLAEILFELSIEVKRDTRPLKLYSN